MTFQHVSFFNLASLSGILGKVGLEILDADFSEMDGGSITISVGNARRMNDQKVVLENVLAYERAFEFNKASGYENFFTNFQLQDHHIRDFLESQALKGIRVVAYGAGAKGQAILNMLDIGRDLVGHVIDDTPGYGGQFVPGVGTEVIRSDDPEARDAGLILITAPTHVQEIMKKKEYRTRKGIPFISSIPGFHFAVPKRNLKKD